MKCIVLIDETAKPGGAEINLIGMLPRLKQEGWNPLLLVPEEGQLVDKLTACGVSCRVVPGGPFRSISSYVGSDLKIPDPLAFGETLINGRRWASALNQVLREIQPDIVQTVSMLAHIFGGWAAREAGLPVVFHVQDIVERNSGFGLYHAIFQSWASKVPFRIAGISPLVQDQFRVNPKTMEKTRVIWNMVDTEKFQPSIASRRNGRLRIGSVARLTRWKGQVVALQVARRLKRRGVQFQWHFAGDETLGDQGYAHELGQHVKQWELEQEVRFLGWIENMDHFYDSLDLLVHLAVEPEPFGLVIGEALSCGLPVIATHGGLDEIIKETEGLLVPVGDVESAADAIMNVAGQLPEHRTIYQQKGHAAASTYFSPRTIVPQWLSLYEEVLNANSQVGI